MIRSGVKAIVLGSALTAFSLFYAWQGIDSTFRGFPFLFAIVIPGFTYQNSAGMGTDSWCFLGWRPFIADLLIWTAVAWIGLRFVKGTASALFAVAAVYLVWGFVRWRQYGDYFDWSNWCVLIFGVSIYTLLGFHSLRSHLAAFTGAGVFSALMIFQMFQGVDMLMSDMFFKMPIAILLLCALVFRSRHRTPNALQPTPGGAGRSAVAGGALWSRVAELWRLATMKLILLFAVGALLAGCRTCSTRTADQFGFLEVGMPMTVVSNRVGMPDLPYRGQIRWRYRLADGTEMAVVAEAEKEPYTFETWRVVWFGQSRDGEWMWIQPPEILK